MDRRIDLLQLCEQLSGEPKISIAGRRNLLVLPVELVINGAQPDQFVFLGGRQALVTIALGDKALDCGGESRAFSSLVEWLPLRGHVARPAGHGAESERGVVRRAGLRGPGNPRADLRCLNHCSDLGRAIWLWVLE